MPAGTLVRFSLKDLSPVACVGDVSMGNDRATPTVASTQHLNCKSAQPLKSRPVFEPVRGLGGQDTDAVLHSIGAMTDYNDFSVAELRWKYYAERERAAPSAGPGSASPSVSSTATGGELVGAAPCTLFSIDGEHVGVRPRFGDTSFRVRGAVSQVACPFHASVLKTVCCARAGALSCAIH